MWKAAQLTDEQTASNRLLLHLISRPLFTLMGFMLGCLLTTRYRQLKSNPKTIDYIRTFFNQEGKYGAICRDLAGQRGHLVWKCMKQCADSNSSFKIQCQEGMDSTCTFCHLHCVSNGYTSGILALCSMSVSVCSDKAWEMTAMREMPTQASVCECLDCSVRLFSNSLPMNGCQLSRLTMFLNNTLTTRRLSTKSH